MYIYVIYGFPALPGETMAGVMCKCVDIQMKVDKERGHCRQTKTNRERVRSVRVSNFQLPWLLDNTLLLQNRGKQGQVINTWSHAPILNPVRL